jgi:hypothetical protein
MAVVKIDSLYMFKTRNIVRRRFVGRIAYQDARDSVVDV